MSIKLNSQSNYTSFFHTPEAVFISTDCLWRSLSQYVRFPFTEPGLCTNTGVFFFFRFFGANTEHEQFAEFDKNCMGLHLVI